MGLAITLFTVVSGGVAGALVLGPVGGAIGAAAGFVFGEFVI